MIFALKYWKELAIGVVLVLLFAMWRSRENALVERGRAQERVRVQDSILKAVTPQRLKRDTLVVRDTLRVRQTVERVVSLRDTLRITDTLAVKVFVQRTDTALQACSDLANNCAAFRLFANQTIAALQTKLDAQPIAMPRSCAVSTTVGTVLGAVVGAAGGYLAHRP